MFSFGGGNFSRRTFQDSFRCHSVSLLAAEQQRDPAVLEFSDKIILPPSCLEKLAHLEITYPMIFELTNPRFLQRRLHCGVLEFIAQEGMIYLPFWMMENMHLNEGDIVHLKSAATVSLTSAPGNVRQARLPGRFGTSQGRSGQQSERHGLQCVCARCGAGCSALPPRCRRPSRREASSSCSRRRPTSSRSATRRPCSSRCARRSPPRRARLPARRPRPAPARAPPRLPGVLIGRLPRACGAAQSLRSFSALTKGETFRILYNKKKYDIGVVEVRPAGRPFQPNEAEAVCIIEADVEARPTPPRDHHP
jgi:hypothetical protein